MTHLMAPWDDWGDGLLSGYTSSQHLVVSWGNWFCQRKKLQRISKTYRLQIVGPFDLDSVEVVQNPGKLVGKVFRLRRKGNKVNTRNLETPFSLFANIFRHSKFYTWCLFVLASWLAYCIFCSSELLCLESAAIRSFPISFLKEMMLRKKQDKSCLIYEHKHKEGTRWQDFRISIPFV